MTEPARRGRPSATPVVAGAAAAFLAVLALAAWQLGAGRDPALGAGPSVADKRVVIVRRVIVQPRRPGRRAATPARAAAPVRSAPPPAPAPIVTRAS